MNHFGPLAALAGEWEGDDGLDVSYHHAVDEIRETPYREHITFKPFGPVDNGDQQMYGLDYKMAAWRAGEENPFHTEVGYWLWCAGLGHVMRGFLVPRGTVVLAGGPAAPDATTFTLTATHDSDEYGVLSNPYLAQRAKCVRYEVTVTVEGDVMTYEEDTVLQMTELPDLVHHTDRNRLRRVAVYELPPPA
ncbi:MAG: FABP family protein [Acidimicrobiales bacterium]|nr:FABP family protein [Acidimicrobiales bacterium]